MIPSFLLEDCVHQLKSQQDEYVTRSHSICMIHLPRVNCQARGTSPNIWAAIVIVNATVNRDDTLYTVVGCTLVAYIAPHANANGPKAKTMIFGIPKMYFDGA